MRDAVRQRSQDRLVTLIYGTYFTIHISTFIYLTFYKEYEYTWWNWIIVVPINFFQASLWPIYWTILHWID